MLMHTVVSYITYDNIFCFEEKKILLCKIRKFLNWVKLVHLNVQHIQHLCLHLML